MAPADFELCRQLAGDPLLSMLPVGQRMEFYGTANSDLPAQPDARVRLTLPQDDHIGGT